MNPNLINWLAKLHMQPPTARLLTGFVTVLALFSLAGWLAAKHVKPESRLAKALQQLNGRLQSMWSIVVVFSIAMLTGGVGSIFVFAGCSFLLLREFITITPTRKADQRSDFGSSSPFSLCNTLSWAAIGMGCLPYLSRSMRSCFSRSGSLPRQILKNSSSAPPRFNGR